MRDFPGSSARPSVRMPIVPSLQYCLLCTRNTSSCATNAIPPLPSGNAPNTVGLRPPSNSSALGEGSPATYTGSKGDDSVSCLIFTPIRTLVFDSNVSKTSILFLRTFILLLTEKHGVSRTSLAPINASPPPGSEKTLFTRITLPPNAT